MGVAALGIYRAEGDKIQPVNLYYEALKDTIENHAKEEMKAND